MIIRAFAALSAVVLMVVAAGAAPSTSRAVGPRAWFWPGCAAQQGRANDKLQDCIDGAGPGDSIEITTNSPIQEFFEINRSLDLHGSPGFHPVLFGGRVRTLTAAPIQATIRHLTASITIAARFDKGSGHVLTVDDVTITPGSTAAVGLFEVEAAVPVTVALTHSLIDIGRPSTHDGISFWAHHGAGLVTFSVIGTRISGHQNDTSGGGMEILIEGNGSTRLNLMNNSIWDVAGCNCGSSAGISVRSEGAGIVDLNVVGTTIQPLQRNALYVNKQGSGGHVSMDVYNNIFSEALRGIYIDTTSVGVSSVLLRAGANDFYRNQLPNILEGRSAGAGNLALAPKYVNASTGDLRLQAGSPLIDKGIVCSPGGVANPDAAGRHRLARASVDIGAFEFGALPVNGKVVQGTSANETIVGSAGNDILCGYAGNDTLRGGAGNDYLDGGGGNDILLGGPGSDRLFGGPGNDTLCAADGERGNDRLDGGVGFDGYRADTGDSRVSLEERASC